MDTTLMPVGRVRAAKGSPNAGRGGPP